ncbi:MAG TPA: hypothetical protein VGX68_11775 [Thermoanaerobaculia bacterium]|nr:hypothetical protein [Thermoanaerobaculia bacterium]
MSKRFASAASAVVLVSILVPQPSPAAPRFWTSLSVPAASFFERLEGWWGRLVNGPEDLQKNGIGMDPNGEPAPAPPTGTNQVTEPSPDGSGAG